MLDFLLDKKVTKIVTKKKIFTEEDLKNAFSAGHDSARKQNSYKSNGTYKEDLKKYLKQIK